MVTLQAPQSDHKKRQEYVDSTGRTIVPVAQENIYDHYDAWKNYCLQLDPKSMARHQGRLLVESGLNCPSRCTSFSGELCSVIKNAATAPLPWNKQPGSAYDPFLWKNYLIDNFEYDLVVYRRPRRSLLFKVLCCGA